MKFRCSLSVEGFRDKIKEVWRLEEWKGTIDEDQDVLFFGLYTLHDFDAWWYHEGKKSVFWCGSDILNVLNNIEFQRRLKLYPDAKHYCETEIEAENLKSLGIKPSVIPSFLESEDEFPISYTRSDTPHIWMCAHPGREKEYGVDVMIRMARKFPDYTFHIYGIFSFEEEVVPDNVFFHGQVPNDQLNKEIKQYQCGFRGNLHEGLSEVPVKAVLMGQYAITKMKFDWFWNYQTDEELEELLKKLKDLKDWNHEGRREIKGKLNKFPWLSLGHSLKEAIKSF
ncbi:MAG TPA: hypothetical protein ENH85_01240 [Candidatus Scalindua sp.]|nr:hypothetical protein [Candidatus Scalindua sp.]